MTEWVLFAAGSPGAPDEADGPIALATGFEIILAGTYWITHVEWFAPTNSPAGVEVAIWERVSDGVAGANLTGNLAWAGAITNGVRNRMALPAAVPVSSALYPNGLYVVLRTGTRYTATAAYFNAAETQGPLRGWADTTGKENGRFKVGASDAEYPTTSFNKGGYWITPVLTDVDPGGGGDVVITDTPGSVMFRGSDERVDSTVPDADSGWSLAGGSDEQVLTFETVSIADTPGFTQYAGSTDTVAASAPLPDPDVWPLLAGSLACLEDAVARVENPPKYVSIRPGIAFSAGLSQMEDECCEGSAWIRVVSISPTDNFPSPRGDASNCAPVALAVVLELGVLRCRPVTAAGDASKIVTSAQWAEVSRLVMNDAAALRRAACCMVALAGNGVIGTWSPEAVEANCVGGTMTVTIQAPNCDITC